MGQFACTFIPSESYKHVLSTYCMLATVLSFGSTIETRSQDYQPQEEGACSEDASRVRA